MSPESSQPTTTPSAVSWERLAATTPPSHRLAGEHGQALVWLADHGAGSRGAFSTLNISDWPNDAAVCSLSQVLVKGPIPPQYFLSSTACAGILRRAEKRGKKLPEPLMRALTAVASPDQTELVAGTTCPLIALLGMDTEGNPVLAIVEQDSHLAVETVQALLLLLLL